MASSTRFDNLDEETLDKIVTEKDSANTHQVIKTAVNILKDYLRETSMGTNEEMNTGTSSHVTGNSDCLVANLEKYLSKLHPDNTNMWQRQKNKICDSVGVWYDNSPLSKNTFNNFMANKHRVVIPKEEISQKKRRRSTFFVRPDDEVIIECLDKSGKYEPIKNIDYLYSQFANIY